MRTKLKGSVLSLQNPVKLTLRFRFKKNFPNTSAFDSQPLDYFITSLGHEVDKIDKISKLMLNQVRDQDFEE